MDLINNTIDSDTHASLHSHRLLAPPPSPTHFEGLEAPEKKMQESRKSKRRWETLSFQGKHATLADELTTSLAAIAREERRKVGYLRGDVSGRSSVAEFGRHSGAESDGGGASEESWFSFLGSRSAGPPVVTAAATSSGEDRSSSGNTSRTDMQRRSHGPGPGAIGGHGLPIRVDDKVVGASHATVVARLPPPQLKSSTGSSSSGRSSDEVAPWQRSPHRRHVKHTILTFKSGGVHDQADLARHATVPKPKKSCISSDLDESESSSGSGSEGGYDASSSDYRASAQPSSCSSPSTSSSEGHHCSTRRPKRKINRSDSVGSSDSSDIPDFSPSPPLMAPSEADSGVIAASWPTHRKKRSHDGARQQSPVLLARLSGADQILPVIPTSTVASKKMQLATLRRHQGHQHLHRSLLRDNYVSAMGEKASAAELDEKPAARHRAQLKKRQGGQASIFNLGSDLMAQCVSFLEPLEVHSLLTTPLSKQWRTAYTMPQDLWRVLCLIEPFKANFGAEDLDSSDDSVYSEVDVNHPFGKYRLLYTSFIRCLRYLVQIKDDAIHGRPPSVLDYGGGDLNGISLTSNSSLRGFLAKARSALNKSKPQSIAAAHVNVSDNDAGAVDSEPNRKKVKSEEAKAHNVQFGNSMLTQRLLGPSRQGDPGDMNLPWSCAIYSIVNWMVAFSDVEGIQTMCLKVLPYLLEDEGQRTTAQHAGLTDIVLRGMVSFPDSVQLHTAAFHTIVLLARPLGGKEGMLFRSSMVNSSGIFNSGDSRSGRNGIAVMLDSMKRFEHEDILQAMSCWSLVNIALAPTQKSVLVKLGGITATANAMKHHPYNAEVQFRALFALINLVIPCKSCDGIVVYLWNLFELHLTPCVIILLCFTAVDQSDESTVANELQELLGDVNQTIEKDMLDESVGQIANLVVLAMKHFCSSESILNRACLVLHNLSLTVDYHTTLLWTPCCYQMLEWCLANYRTDQVLQQSAAGTLHRLQETLARDSELRHQFASFLQTQQQTSLEQVQKEALLLQEQHQG